MWLTENRMLSQPVLLNKSEVIYVETEKMKKEGYFDAFGDAYNLLKTLPEHAEQCNLEYWTKVTSRGNEIVKKYRDTSAELIVRCLVNDVLNEIERVYYANGIVPFDNKVG